MNCESCFENEAELDGLIDGEYRRMCGNCAVLDKAIVLSKPSKANIEESFRRYTVKEVLMNASGVHRPHARPIKRNVSLEDLRKPKPRIIESARNEEERPRMNVSLGEVKDDEVLDI